MEDRYLSLGLLYILGFQLISDVEFDKNRLRFNKTEVVFPDNWKDYISNVDCVPIRDINTINTDIVDYFSSTIDLDTIIKKMSLIKTVVLGNVFDNIPEELLKRLQMQIDKLNNKKVSYQDLLKYNLDIPITVFEILIFSVKSLNLVKDTINEDFIYHEPRNQVIDFKPKICLENAESTLIMRKLLECRGYIKFNTSDEVHYSSNIFGWLEECWEEILSIIKEVENLDEILHEVLTNSNVILNSTDKMKNFINNVLKITDAYNIAVCNSYIDEYYNDSLAKVTIYNKKYVRSCLNYVCDEEHTLLNQFLNKL